MHFRTTQIRRVLRENAPAILLGIVLFGLIALQSTLIYQRTNFAMSEQLRMRLRTAAALSADKFTGEELDRIRGKESMSSPLFRGMVARLNVVLDTVPNVKFAYIMRRTDDPMTLEFVADADSLETFEESDANGDGVLDPDEETSLPGDLYDISDIIAMQEEAFEGPTTDAEITVDQWGQLISGYAPIRRADGSVAGIIGIDMDAHDFFVLSRRAFSPLALLILVTIALVTVGMFAYLTWERRIAALRMLENERSSLLALATHQMGGPIASIRWWIEVMDDEGRCKGNPACEQLLSASNRLNDIMLTLIDVERKEQHINFAARQSDIQTLIRTAVEEASANIGKKHDVRVAVDGEVVVNLDPKLIGGALIELLENAMWYSDNGTRIEIRALHKGNFVEIAIKDEGCGIRSDELSHVFDKLRRGKEAYRYKPNGNGLGLYTAKLIVERAGGSVKVASEPGKGSTFTVRLPVS